MGVTENHGGVFPDLYSYMELPSVEKQIKLVTHDTCAKGVAGDNAVEVTVQFDPLKITELLGDAPSTAMQNEELVQSTELTELVVSTFCTMPTAMGEVAGATTPKAPTWVTASVAATVNTPTATRISPFVFPVL